MEESKKIEFSEDIKKLMAERYPDKDIYNMDLKELKQFRETVEELREEFFMLELSMKQLGNAAYGACANQFFYFYNTRLAADITGECRSLTKFMWDRLEKFFHEDIWERKDLWKKFGFELNPEKKEWFRSQVVSTYSDTDSLAKNSVLLLKKNGKVTKQTFEDFWNTNKIDNECFIDSNGKEISNSNYEVLNWSKDKGLYFAPIKYVMKHKVSKARYKICTKSGKEIIVTGDHSCIVFRNGKQLPIKAKDINPKTDKILSIVTNEQKQ